MKTRPECEATWAEAVRTHRFGYARQLVDLTAMWAEAMERQLARGFTVPQIADASFTELCGSLKRDVPTLMFDQMLQMLANYWAEGDALLAYHNAQLGVEATVAEAHTAKRIPLSVHGGVHPRAHRRASLLGLARHG